MASFESKVVNRGPPRTPNAYSPIDWCARAGAGKRSRAEGSMRAKRTAIRQGLQVFGETHLSDRSSLPSGAEAARHANADAFEHCVARVCRRTPLTRVSRAASSRWWDMRFREDSAHAGWSGLIEASMPRKDLNRRTRTIIRRYKRDKLGAT